MKVVIGIVVFVGLSLLIGFMAYASANDTEIELRQTVEAKQDVCKSNRDKLHQTLFNVAEIPDRFMEKSKEAFMDIYPSLMEARYGDARGGALMSWVTESNPNFDMSAAKDLYENLQIAIEANFKEFDKKQTELIDAQATHAVYIKKTWNNVFWNFKERGEVEIVILQGGQVQEEYSNGGTYDGVDLFGDKDKESK